jgi:hypothetical protein
VARFRPRSSWRFLRNRIQALSKITLQNDPTNQEIRE